MRARAAASSAVGAARRPGWISRCAVSRSRPVGVAARVLQNFAAGRDLGRAGVMPESSIALRVDEARVAAGVREHDGIVRRHACRATRGSESLRRSASGRDVHFSWCQPRPMIHSPGLAVFAASRDHRDDLVPARTFIRFRFSCASPTPVKWPWPSMKPGMASCPCTSITCVLRPDVALDVGRGAERRDPIAGDGDRLRFRHGVVDGDDAAVGQDEVGGRRLRACAAARAAPAAGRPQHSEPSSSEALCA